MKKNLDKIMVLLIFSVAVSCAGPEIVKRNYKKKTLNTLLVSILLFTLSCIAGPEVVK